MRTHPGPSALHTLPVLLARSGAVSTERLAAADRRRAVYGGTLDTVLLEMDAIDELTLTTHLAQATGLPAALPEQVAAPDPQATATMDGADARRLGAVPIGRQDDRVDMALRPEADRIAVEAWTASRGLELRATVVPEVRFQELLATVYREPLPPRTCAVLGKLVGADRVRKLVLERAPPPPLAPPPVDTGPRLPEAPRAAPEPDPEIDVVEDAPPDPAREIDELLASLSRAATTQAPRIIESLAERRAVKAIPLLLDRLGDRNVDVAKAAHAALVVITRQDFGTARRSWNGWWRKAKDQHRNEWLLEALAHKRSDIRSAASQELQSLTGVYFGYHYDLPERDREEARRRWTEWWHTTGGKTL